MSPELEIAVMCYNHNGEIYDGSPSSLHMEISVLRDLYKGESFDADIQEALNESGADLYQPGYGAPSDLIYLRTDHKVGMREGNTRSDAKLVLGELNSLSSQQMTLDEVKKFCGGCPIRARHAMRYISRTGRGEYQAFANCDPILTNFR